MDELFQSRGVRSGRPEGVTAAEAQSENRVQAKLRAVAASGSGPLERMRAAGLRATVARIGVLQVMQTSDQCLSVEDVFAQMLSRGTHVSIGTLYRVIYDLESHEILLRERDRNGRSMYRIQPDPQDTEVLHVVCTGSGRSFPIDDVDLHARMVAAMKAMGFDIPSRTAMSIHVDLTCTPPSRKRPWKRP